MRTSGAPEDRPKDGGWPQCSSWLRPTAGDRVACAGIGSFRGEKLTASGGHGRPPAEKSTGSGRFQRVRNGETSCMTDWQATVRNAVIDANNSGEGFVPPDVAPERAEQFARAWWMNWGGNADDFSFSTERGGLRIARRRERWMEPPSH